MTTGKDLMIKRKQLIGSLYLYLSLSEAKRSDVTGEIDLLRIIDIFRSCVNQFHNNHGHFMVCLAYRCSPKEFSLSILFCRRSRRRSICLMSGMLW